MSEFEQDDTAFVQGFLDRGEQLPPGEYRITGRVCVSRGAGVTDAPAVGGWSGADEEDGMTPEEIVEAIWDRWERDLVDWELEGATANAEARRLAVEVIAGLMGAGKLRQAGEDVGDLP